MKAQTKVCATGVLASRFVRWARDEVDGGDDEGVAEDASGAGPADGYGGGAGDWADGRASAGEDGFDLRDGFAHLWMGPLVARAHQAAGDPGARILRHGRARGRRSARGYGGGFRQRGNARQLRALPPVPAGAGAHLP